MVVKSMAASWFQSVFVPDSRSQDAIDSLHRSGSESDLSGGDALLKHEHPHEWRDSKFVLDDQLCRLEGTKPCSSAQEVERRRAEAGEIEHIAKLFDHDQRTVATKHSLRLRSEEHTSELQSLRHL